MRMVADNHSDPLSHLAADPKTGHLSIVVEDVPILPGGGSACVPRSGQRDPTWMGTIP